MATNSAPSHLSPGQTLPIDPRQCFRRRDYKLSQGHLGSSWSQHREGCGPSCDHDDSLVSFSSWPYAGVDQRIPKSGPQLTRQVSAPLQHHHHAVSRPRDHSQQSAPGAFQLPLLESSISMDPNDRRTSLTSSDVRLPDLLSHDMSQSAVEAWSTNGEEPLNPFTIGSNAQARVSCSRSGGLDQISSSDEFLDPSDYLARLSDSGDGGVLSSLSPTSWPCGLESTQGFSSFQNAILFPDSLADTQRPTTPTTAELTSDSSLTSSLSREPSLASSTVCEGFGMMRFASGLSPSTEILHENRSPVNDLLSTPSNEQNSCFVEETRSHVLRGTGGFSEDVPSQSIPPYAIQAPDVSSLSNAEAMQRTVSSESNCSVSSDRSARHLANSKRRIAPRSSAVKADKLQPASDATHDSISNEKLPIPKTNYLRPPPQRVHCPRCEHHPDGFRSEHELKRHMDREHSKTKTAFICVDISKDKKFLSKCKACATSKKYNIYYNAAAHLRRAHFHPRQRRGSSSKVEESRAGKSGGNDPPMEFLRRWMKEVEVVESGGLSLKGEVNIEAEGHMEEDIAPDDSYEQSPTFMQQSFSDVPLDRDMSLSFQSMSPQVLEGIAATFENTDTGVLLPTSNLSLESIHSYALSNHLTAECAELYFPLLATQHLDARQVCYRNSHTYPTDCSSNEQTSFRTTDSYGASVFGAQ
ncbi:MAG: hypothetical protein M1837_006520 [Sclerophora amabilis]|nr:MAG: hypothetical protein M1837_006520 [Sclerophora amabilis]